MSIYDSKCNNTREIKHSSEFFKISKVFVELHYFEMWENSADLYLEYLKGGSLYDEMLGLNKAGKKFERIYILFQFRNLSYALAMAHARFRAHRDIKPANIFLTAAKFMKIGDFGSSKNTTEDKSTFIRGTEKYMPEYYQKMEKIKERGEEHHRNSDIYGFGLTLLECLLGASIKEKPGIDKLPNNNELDQRYIQLFSRMIIEEDTFQITMKEIHE